MVECLLFLGARAVAGGKNRSRSQSKTDRLCNTDCVYFKRQFCISGCCCCISNKLTFPGIVTGLTLRRIEAQARQAVRSQRRYKIPRYNLRCSRENEILHDWKISAFFLMTTKSNLSFHVNYFESCAQLWR